MEYKIKDEYKLISLCSPITVHNFITELWKCFPEYDKGRENFFVLYLDVKNRLLSVELHAQGTLDMASVYPREIIRKALFCNSGSIILIHNHPSNINHPSQEDIQLTNRVKDACKIMDILLIY